MTQERIFDGPALVVIDGNALRYARYFGRKHTMTVQGQEALSAVEVEMYRVDPHKFMGIDQ
jgi:hypothetical protein